MHVIFHSGCTNLHFQKQCTWVSFFPNSCQHLLFLVFLIVAILFVWDDTSLLFWLVSSWWLVMLSIYSCVSPPCVCLLWKNVYLNLLDFFLRDWSNAIAFFLYPLNPILSTKIQWLVSLYVHKNLTLQPQIIDINYLVNN